VLAGSGVATLNTRTSRGDGEVHGGNGLPGDADGEGLPSDGLDLTRAVEGMEERLLRQALERADGVKAEAARLLGLKPSALYYKLEKYGIEA
jgi:DNA-binding NtrC family response regulator